MNSILLLFGSITGLFFLMLLIKTRIRKTFCAICASMSLTWLAFLLLYFLDIFEDRMLLGVLMGESAVGLYYLLEKKLPEKFHIFRLPFLLSETWVVYLVLGEGDEFWKVLLFLATLWFVFTGIFFFRENKKVSRIVKKLVECCKNW